MRSIGPFTARDTLMAEIAIALCAELKGKMGLHVFSLAIEAMEQVLTHEHHHYMNYN